MLVVDRITPGPTPAPATTGERLHRRVAIVQQSEVVAATVQVAGRGRGLQIPGRVDLGVDEWVDIDGAAVGVQ